MKPLRQNIFIVVGIRWVSCTQKIFTLKVWRSRYQTRIFRKVSQRATEKRLSKQWMVEDADDISHWSYVHDIFDGAVMGYAASVLGKCKFKSTKKPGVNQKVPAYNKFWISQCRRFHKQGRRVKYLCLSFPLCPISAVLLKRFWWLSRFFSHWENSVDPQVHCPWTFIRRANT